MADRSVLLSFMMILSMSSLAHCSLLDGIIYRNIIPDITGINQVSVSGVLVCPFPATVKNEPSLPAGTNVALTCGGGRTVVSDAVTDTEGFFEITVNTLDTSLFHPNQCGNCRIGVTGTSLAACGIHPARRGALLAPVNCHRPIVDQLHGHGYGDGKYVVRYKAQPFYFDPSYY